MREILRLSWTVVVRNWRVYAQDFIANISPTVIEPALMLLALGAGLGPFVSQVQGRPYLQFLAPGIVASTSLFTAFFEASYAFYVKMTFESIFKAMLTTPLGVREVMIGEMLWEFLKGAAMATGVTLVLACFGLVAFWPWVLAMPVIGGLIALPWAAVGLMASGAVRNINQFQTVYSFIISPVYFFSGIFFPITSAPKWFQTAVQFSPLYHGVRLAQMAFWNDFHAAEAALHVTVLVVYSAVFIAIAARLIRKKLIA